MFLQKSKSRKEVIGDEELGQLLTSMQINGEKKYNCEKIGPKRQAKMHDFFGNERRVKNKNNARVDNGYTTQRLLLHRESKSKREFFSTFEDLINNLKVRKTPNKIVYESLKHFLNKSHSKNLGITRVYNGLKSIPRVNLPSSDFKRLVEQYDKRKDITISGEDFKLIYNIYEQDEKNAKKSKSKFINLFSEGIKKLDRYIWREDVENVKTFLKTFPYSINYFDIPRISLKSNEDETEYEYYLDEDFYEDKVKNPLMYAAKWERLEMVQVLLQHEEINVNVQDEKGDTALMYAVKEGNLDIVQALLEHPRIDVNLQNNDGHNALIIAVLLKYRELDIVKALLEHPRIDVNLQERDGNTTLIIAANNGYLEIVKELLKHPKIDVNVQNKDGETALILAAKYRNSDIVYQIVSLYKKIFK
jgi:hypothetical protein